MLKKLIFSSFMSLSFFVFAYPTKKENTKPFNYCHSFEKILLRNSIELRQKIPYELNSISNNFSQVGVVYTKGKLINKIINQYKISRKSIFINIWPNNFYCIVGYWIEIVKPGTIESIFYEKIEKTVNKIDYFKKEIDLFLKEINSEYRNMKKEFKTIFFDELNQKL